MQLTLRDQNAVPRAWELQGKIGGAVSGIEICGGKAGEKNVAQSSASGGQLYS